MQNKYFRSGLVLASAVAIAMLNGCANSPPKYLLEHDFTDTLSQPRPKTLEQSIAMKKMYSEFDGYSDRVLGCLMDTAIWEDEKGLTKGGFDVVEVYESTLGTDYKDEDKKKHLESLILKHGTVPGLIRDEVKKNGGKNPVADFVNNSLSFHDIHTGFDKLGVGYSGLVATYGLLSEAFAAYNEWRTVLNFRNTILSYRQTPEDAKYLKDHYLDDPQSYKAYEEITDYYTDKIFAVIVDAAKELGYEVVGNRVTTTELKDNAKTFYPLEGNGCPKANLKNPWKGCYVALAVGKNKKGLSHYVHLGKRDLKTASVVFDWNYDYNIYGPDHTKEITRDLYTKMKQIIIRKNPNITFYFPAEEINGQWYPNRVVDKTGTYYFVVPVKRNVETSRVITKKKRKI